MPCKNSKTCQIFINFIRLIQHNSYWEANCFVVCQEISHVVMCTCVHHLDHKNLSYVSTLCKINPIHPIYCKIHFHVILSFIPRHSKWSHFFRFPTKLLYAILNSPMCATCHPAKLFCLNLITVIISGNVMKLLTMQFSPTSGYFLLLWCNW
jgi:hypothetical protein